jgi:transposase
MEKASASTVIKWRAQDQALLTAALKTAKDARMYQRILALGLVAGGLSISATARLLRRSRQSVHHWLKRYGRQHRIEDLQEAPRSGRPKQAPVLTEARILRELHRSPLELGYAATTWTVPLLTWHVQQRYRCRISPWTLRQRMKQMGLKWKRPRYVYAEKDPHRVQKKGLSFAGCGTGLPARLCSSRMKPSSGCFRHCAVPGP